MASPSRWAQFIDFSPWNRPLHDQVDKAGKQHHFHDGTCQLVACQPKRQPVWLFWHISQPVCDPIQNQNSEPTVVSLMKAGIVSVIDEIIRQTSTMPHQTVKPFLISKAKLLTYLRRNMETVFENLFEIINFEFEEDNKLTEALLKKIVLRFHEKRCKRLILPRFY